MEYDVSNPDSIESYARLLRNKSLKQVLSTSNIQEIKNFGQRGTGELGLMLEKFYFGIEPNSRPEPDFREAGVELKTAAVIKRKGRLVPKEPRLVLGLIDYCSVHQEKWATSSFLKKNTLLLLMFYLYESQQLSIEQIFKIIGLWRFPERDLLVIRKDWEHIISKVKAGKAHEISEGDTYYLGACTKGATASGSLVKQPFSDQRAPQRAFGLKRTYLEAIIAEMQAKQTDIEPAIKATEDLVTHTAFEQAIYDKFKPFLGLSAEAIAKTLNFTLPPVSTKDRYAKLARAVLGVKANKIEEFEKAGISIKTIRLMANGKPKEDMSFPYFKYTEIIKENWPTSTLREQFEKKFFFVIFQLDSLGVLVFKKVMFWNMPYDALENNVKKVWEKTISQIKKAKADDLPKKLADPVCHIRPHAKNKKDTLPTPHNGNLEKKSFWLNNTYIKQQIGLIK